MTVQQPWATLIIRGGKDIENRSWYTEYRGKVWIHAGQTWDESARAQRFLEQSGISLATFEKDVGHVIGSVKLVAVTRGAVSPWAVPGFWHWVFWQPVPLNPRVPRRGNRGLTEYSP